jgi:hypothetical protein
VKNCDTAVLSVVLSAAKVAIVSCTGDVTRSANNGWLFRNAWLADDAEDDENNAIPMNATMTTNAAMRINEPRFVR